MSRRAAVVLSAGWAGDRVLVRLLSPTGAVRVLGQPLDRPVRSPADHLRRVLTAEGPSRAAVVLPHHLWLLNAVDPTAFVGDLVRDGIAVLSLARRSSDDRGLSLALCGPRSEVVPRAPKHVDAAEVVLHAHENDLAVAWFAEVVPDAAGRLTFEDDLATPEAREATAARVARLLGLDPWAAPPDREVPDHSTLWNAVANPSELEAGLAAVRSASGA